MRAPRKFRRCRVLPPSARARRLFVRRLEEACALAAGNVPSSGRGSGDRELMIAVEGLAVRKSQRRIAAAIHGEAAVAGEGFDDESALRAQIRRLVEKAEFLMQGGYLELAAGLRPRL